MQANAVLKKANKAKKDTVISKNKSLILHLKVRKSKLA
jgi:hypothetical protein